MYDEIKKKAVKAFKWAALGQWLSRLSQPLILLLIARNVSQSNYGALETALLVIAFAQIFQDMGLNRAIIQFENITEKENNFVFFANTIFSLICFIAIFFLAPVIANLVGDAQAIGIIRFASVQLLIIALGSIQIALFQRVLNYNKIFISQLIGNLVTFITAIILLQFGKGIWSYIIGSVSGQVVQTILLWILSSWRPSFSINLEKGIQFLKFGVFVAIEGLEGWFLNFGDNLIVGIFFGTEGLGKYALAFNITIYSVGLLLNPISSIAYASFSRLQQNIQELAKAYLNLLRFLAIVVFPITAIFLCFADPIVFYFFGEKWENIGVLIRILTIFPGLSYLHLINSEVYKAIGKPQIMPKIMLIAIMISIPTYLVGINYGLIGFTLARASIGLIFFPVHFLLVKKILSLHFSQIWENLKKPFFASVLMITISNLLNSPIMQDNSNGLTNLMFSLTISVFVYLITLVIIDWESIKKIANLVSLR